MARILIVFSLLFVSHSKAFASSCCGQSPASFTVLSLNQKLSLNAGYSLIDSQGRVHQDSNQFYVWDDKKRQVQSFSFEAASQIAQRHQIFLKTSMLLTQYQDSFEDGSAQDLADTLIGYSYELLPEYTFSYWKPVIYISALLNVPTGKSVHEATRLSEGADATGHNQWGPGIGMTLRKVFFPLTLTFQTRSLYILPKQFEDIKVSGFFDNSLALLGTYAFSFWNLSANTGITMNHLSQRKIQPANLTSGITRSTTLLIGLQKVLNDNSSLSVNYADQTLLGRARNSILNRTYTLNFNYNYF